jgi:signal transduction histidine kinase
MFFTNDMDAMLIAYNYSWPLVVLSLALAILGSALAIYIANLANTIHTLGTRQLVRFTGAAAFGGAVWSMHFVGMLAFALCVTVKYDPWLTLLSSLPAFFAAWWSMGALGQTTHSPLSLLGHSVLLGAGIGIMHYSGMAAMQMTAVLRFDPLLVVLSVATAIVLSAIALYLMSWLNRRNGPDSRRSVWVGGTGLGLAIASMHYVGMRSARFVGFPETDVPTPPQDYLYLSALVLIGSISILLLAFIGSLLARLRSQHNTLAAIHQDYSQLLEQVTIGVIAYDATGKILFANPTAAWLLDATSKLSALLDERLAQPETYERLQELTVHRPIGKPLHLLLTISARGGSATGHWVILTDVTSLREQQQHTLQSAKLATLGEMSTSMAHEINQPLNAIRLMLQNMRVLLATDPVPQDKVAQKLRNIDDAIDRAAKLVSHMRTYGRVDNLDNKPFELTHSLETLRDIWTDTLRASNIELRIEYPKDAQCWTVGCQTQFEQALLNLITNARDAICEREIIGRLSICLQTVGNQHRITLQDNGGGIAAHQLEKVFEPFFTTKPVGQGTGLGCAISYGIIKDMGGDLTVTNKRGGACFEITLPAYNRADYPNGHDTVPGQE